MGVLLVILFFVLIEIVQILSSKNKIVKWIIPVLSFIVSVSIVLGMTVMEQQNQVSNNMIMYMLVFVVSNIPTLIFVITNYIISKITFKDKTRSILKKCIFVIIAIIIIGYVVLFTTKKPAKVNKNAITAVDLNSIY